MPFMTYTVKRKSPSAKCTVYCEPSISVKRMKNVKNSYMVTVAKKPYCIVEISPYMVWDPDHTFEFPISEQYKKRILDLIHVLENS